MLTDGRTARRDRNRDVVIDAALALFSEGELEPNAILVASRAGVSERSVFRYFEDTDALLRAAIERHMERTAPLFVIEALGEGTLAERIERFVNARVKLYDAVAPTARAAVVRARTNAIIAAQLAQARERLRAQLEAMFAPELDSMRAPQRRATAAAADTLIQFEAVEHMVHGLGLSRTRVRETLQVALTALFTPSSRTRS